jgi:hypothetical protein
MGSCSLHGFTAIKSREMLLLNFDRVGVRVRGAVAGTVREAPHPVGAGEQLHLQDVLLPVHQLLLLTRLYRLLQGLGGGSASFFDF